MPRLRKPNVPAVGSIDLGFRPASYWEAADPLAAIIQNIKGQNRREMARDFLTGQSAEALGEIEDHYLADELDADTRNSLGGFHPSFMGGEYLPAYAPGETEIARIVLQSVTQDVYSVRARRRSGRGRIRYRIVDEYDSLYDLTRQSSVRPLTLAQLIHLIDTADAGETNEAGDPYLENIIRDQLDDGGAESAAGFVGVESTVYPELGEYYDARLLAWALGQVESENEEEAEDR